MKDVSCLDQACFDTLLQKQVEWYRKNKLPAPYPSVLDWTKDATMCCFEIMMELAPDATWKKAVRDSFVQINRPRSANYGSVPKFTENPQSAATMTANLAVLLMSDDNVTLEAFLLYSTAEAAKKADEEA